PAERLGDRTGGDARARAADRRHDLDPVEPGRGHRGQARRSALPIVTVPLKTKILLADDHTVVRGGLRLVLDAQPDLEVVAEASDGREAVDLAVEHEVDLAVLDVTMPRMTGLQAAAELGWRRPEAKVLMLSMHDNEQYFFEALK